MKKPIIKPYRNPITIIHKRIWSMSDGVWVYLCNQACGITMQKSTHQKEFVTCKNCLKKLKGGEK